MSCRHNCEREHYRESERESVGGLGTKIWQMLNVQNEILLCTECIVCTHYSLRVVEHDVVCAVALTLSCIAHFHLLYSYVSLSHCAASTTPCRFRVQFMSVYSSFGAYINHIFFLQAFLTQTNHFSLCQEL